MQLLFAAPLLALLTGQAPVPPCSRRAVLARGLALAAPVPLAAWAAAAASADDAEPAAAPAALDAAPADAAAADATAPPAEAAAPPPAPRGPSAFDFDVPFRGEPQDSKPFLGKATLVVNMKFDDPETVEQMPPIAGLATTYAAQGLHVLAFPTDQGWFEADDSSTLRLKMKSVFGFGAYPTSVVFDKVDLLGGNALPLYGWLTRTLPNPWGVNRLVFNYEKFLLDADGLPLRRYPRKYPPQLIDADIRAALAGQPLPPPPARWAQAWEDAKREATKSEYAFKPGLNYYSFGSPAS